VTAAIRRGDHMLTQQEERGQVWEGDCGGGIGSVGEGMMASTLGGGGGGFWCLTLWGVREQGRNHAK